MSIRVEKVVLIEFMANSMLIKKKIKSKPHLYNCEQH